jgi:hypothetical protein
VNLLFEGINSEEPTRRLFDWLVTLGYAPQEKPVVPMELAGFVLDHDFRYNLTLVENRLYRRVVAKSFMKLTGVQRIDYEELKKTMANASSHEDLIRIQEAMYPDLSVLANALNLEQPNCIISIENGVLTVSQSVQFRDELSPQLFRCFLEECRPIVASVQNHPFLREMLRQSS